jgi:mannose-6-phosphate isomerase-like protein (cupin superfamily)
MPSLEQTHRVPKEWGEERWIVNRDYCGKLLLLRRGWRCSLHYHVKKDEVFYLTRGRVLLEVGGVEHVMVPGDHHHIPPSTPHRFSGLEDSEIVEFSTHHEDEDSHRIERSGSFDLEGTLARLALAAAGRAPG